jgi:hypothetical protein
MSCGSGSGRIRIILLDPDRHTVQGMPIILWIGINDEKDKPKWIGTAVNVSKNPYFCYPYMCKT